MFVFRCYCYHRFVVVKKKPSDNVASCFVFFLSIFLAKILLSVCKNAHQAFPDRRSQGLGPLSVLHGDNAKGWTRQGEPLALPSLSIDTTLQRTFFYIYLYILFRSLHRCADWFRLISMRRRARAH